MQFPATLESLGYSAFQGCSSLKAVDLSNTKLTEIAGYSSFYQAGGTFSTCSNLETVQFPATLETIDYRAFDDCSKLSSVTFADVQNWAVYDDSNYKNKSADIPETDLQDAAKAATLLKSTYWNKYWKKN